MKCLKCGAELSENAKFCSHCGEKIVIPKTSNNTSSKDSNLETDKNKQHKFIRKNANYFINFIRFNVYFRI